MLTIVVPACDDLWDERAERFLHTKETTLVLEHSLLSLTKWEQHYKRPFIDDGPKTNDEIAYYINCMTINKGIDPNVYKAITVDVYKQILEYIGDPMTASTINERSNKPGGKSRERLTSELIYFYMFSYGIPKECEKWHLNNLIMLIKIFGIKNSPDKNNKMSTKDIYAQNKAARAAYRAKHGRH